MARVFFNDFPDISMNIDFLNIIQRPDLEFFANDVQLNSKDENSERFVPRE